MVRKDQHRDLYGKAFQVPDLHHDVAGLWNQSSSRVGCSFCVEPSTEDTHTLERSNVAGEIRSQTLGNLPPNKPREALPLPPNGSAKRPGWSQSSWLCPWPWPHKVLLRGKTQVPDAPQRFARCSRNMRARRLEDNSHQSADLSGGIGHSVRT